MRFVAPLLEQQQRWTLVERDQCLYAKVSQYLEDSGEGVEHRVRYQTLNENFLSPDAQWLNTPCDLITANAVFDLLSTDQFRQLLALIKHHFSESKPVIYFSINLAPLLDLQPQHPHQQAVINNFHAYMQRPQNFGQAMGHESAHIMASQFEHAGFNVSVGHSPWHMLPNETALLEANLAFVHSANRDMIASGQGELTSIQLAEWWQFVQTHVEEKKLSLTVDHYDLFAVWP